MTRTLSGKIGLKWEWLFQNADGLKKTKDDSFKRISNEFTNGTGDDNANQMFVDRRTVSAASPTDDLDLSGVLTNQFGETVTFSEIKGLLIVNLGNPAAGNDGSDSDTWTEAAGQDLLVGGEGANAWSALFDGVEASKLRIRSGGFVAVWAPNDGYSVSPATEDVLRIVWDGNLASGDDIEYDLVIIGVEG